MIPRPGALIVTESPAVADTDALSVALTVKLAVPAVVGVPEMVPLALRFSPAGSEPVDRTRCTAANRPSRLVVGSRLSLPCLAVGRTS